VGGTPIFLPAMGDMPSTVNIHEHRQMKEGELIIIIKEDDGKKDYNKYTI
jgi:hypothetical protein